MPCAKETLNKRMNDQSTTNTHWILSVSPLHSFNQKANSSYMIVMQRVTIWGKKSPNKRSNCIDSNKKLLKIMAANYCAPAVCQALQVLPVCFCSLITDAHPDTLWDLLSKDTVTRLSVHRVACAPLDLGLRPDGVPPLSEAYGIQGERRNKSCKVILSLTSSS